MRRGSCVVSLLAVLGLGVLARNAMPVAATQGGGPKILRVQWASEMPNLEPQTNENGISDLTLLNYEGLTRLDQELNVVPGAAESWEFDAAGTTITFHLRPDLTYSDGSPLTAERFRYAIKRRCDPHLTSWGANALFDIVGCEELNTSLGKTGGTPTADSAAYEAACRAGLGLVQLPAISALRGIREGALLEVLTAHRPAPMPVHLLFPHRRHLPRRVRAFADWIAEVVQDAD